MTKRYLLYLVSPFSQSSATRMQRPALAFYPYFSYQITLLADDSSVVTSHWQNPQKRDSGLIAPTSEPRASSASLAHSTQVQSLNIGTIGDPPSLLTPAAPQECKSCFRVAGGHDRRLLHLCYLIEGFSSSSYLHPLLPSQGMSSLPQLWHIREKLCCLPVTTETKCWHVNRMFALH